MAGEAVEVALAGAVGVAVAFGVAVGVAVGIGVEVAVGEVVSGVVTVGVDVWRKLTKSPMSTNTMMRTKIAMMVLDIGLL